MRTKRFFLLTVILGLAGLAAIGLPARSSAALPRPAAAPYGSGVFLTASIGPNCIGVSWSSTVCARPYIGEFVVTELNGAEVTRVMTNYWGQAVVNLSPGRYLIGARTETIYPRAAPVVVDIADNGYVSIWLRLDAGPLGQ